MTHRTSAATPRRASSAKKTPTPAGRILLSLGGILQVGLALAALSDLWARPAGQVRLSKPAWVPIILINWIGPLAYFVGGVKR